MGVASSSAADEVTPPPRPADRGEKTQRAPSSKAEPPPAFRHMYDPDRTRMARMTAAGRLYDDKKSRLVVCEMQRAGTPNVHLRLRPVEAHPCTGVECHCLIDYVAMAAQMGLVAQYGDGPLAPDAPYVRPPLAVPCPRPLSAPACRRPALPASGRVSLHHAPSCGTPGPTCTCVRCTRRRWRAPCVVLARRSETTSRRPRRRAARRRRRRDRRGRRSLLWTSTCSRAAAPSARRPSGARRRAATTRRAPRTSACAAPVRAAVRP